MKSERAASAKRGSDRAAHRSVDPQLCDLRSSKLPAPGAVAPPRSDLREASESSAAPEFEDAWRALFAGRTPREVLARIVRGEPLGLRMRVSRRLEERALLLDGERCHLRALAHVARASSSYRGTPDFGTWLDQCVDRAMDDFLRGGSLREDSGQDDVDAWTALAKPLNLDPTRARDCCLSFDDRPFDERTAFFELVLRHHSLDEVAERAHCTPTEVAKRARRALLALLAPMQLGLRSVPQDSKEDLT